jgi:PAS domain S-box-containing protein
MKADSAKTKRLQVRPATTVIAPPSDAAYDGSRPESTIAGDAQYTNLLEGLFDGLVIANREGVISRCNRRVEELFQVSRGDLVTRPILEFISGADRLLMERVNDQLATRQNMVIEADCVRRDGSVFPAEIGVGRIDLSEHDQLCFTIRDITVRRQALVALEDAYEQLKEHDKAKSQFVYNVSHELRTPLTSMLYAITNVLKGVAGDISDRVRTHLELLDGDCRRLWGSVNDILDLRRIEDNSIVLSKTHIPLAGLVSNGAASLQVQVDAKTQTLTVETGRDAWFADCDPTKMERVVVNIVGNAVKYTLDGGSIDVRVKDDPTREGFARVEVQDNGLGIPPESIDHVTEMYYRVGEHVSGSGLGLPISKEIIDLHGGYLEIVSPPPNAEGGTLVAFGLPISSPPTVLVVEDDATTQATIVAQLEQHGYCVITASDGEEGLEKVMFNKPDLVVLDLVLPKLDGCSIILKMKTEQATSKIPIVVLSAGHVDQAKFEILNNFEIPALSKPWVAAEFLQRVNGAFIGRAAFFQ